MCPVPARPPSPALPLVDELLQGSALRHQLREAASQHHEGQDGQEVVGATVDKGTLARGSGAQGPAPSPNREAPAQPPVWFCLLLLSLHPSAQST